MFRALDQSINPSLSKEICFGFFSGAGLAIVGTLIHPFHAIDALSAACGFELALDFFLGALFAKFVDALLGLFALGEGFLFFFPDCALVALQRGMEGFLQVEIAATHFDVFCLVLLERGC